MPGHRAVAKVSLRPTHEGGLASPVEPGHKSLLFSFGEDDDEDDVTLGALFEDVEGNSGPGASFRGTLWFWQDVAALHATPGARFTIWYGGSVGSGQILEVLPVW